MKPTILVVEDEPGIVFTVRFVLESAGYSVLDADNGDDALALVEQNDPDAVLLDIRIPGTDGWGVLEHLRETGRLESTPVVMLSAHATPSTAERALDEGASAYITKPFDAEELRSTLDRVVERSN